MCARVKIYEIGERKKSLYSLNSLLRHLMVAILNFEFCILNYKIVTLYPNRQKIKIV